MTIKQTSTYWVKIYMCGEIAVAKQVCREQAISNPPGDPGNCVTIEHADYVYTGGAESGYVIGLICYPRFPSKRSAILIGQKSSRKY